MVTAWKDKRLKKLKSDWVIWKVCLFTLVNFDFFVRVLQSPLHLSKVNDHIEMNFFQKKPLINPARFCTKSNKHGIRWQDNDERCRLCENCNGNNDRLEIVCLNALYLGKPKVSRLREGMQVSSTSLFLHVLPCSLRRFSFRHCIPWICLWPVHLGWEGFKNVQPRWVDRWVCIFLSTKFTFRLS